MTTVAAVPDDMERYAVQAGDAGHDLTDAIRRHVVPIADVVPGLAGLVDDLLRYVSAARAVDAWIGMLAGAFAAADRSAFVGPLLPGALVVTEPSLVASALLACGLDDQGAQRLIAGLDRSATLEVARRVAHRLDAMRAGLTDPAERQRLRRVLAPLRDRLHGAFLDDAVGEYTGAGPGRPRGWDDVLKTLEVEAPRTAGLSAAFVSGAVKGSFDDEGYDNTGGELARLLGDLLSGYAVVGDLRNMAGDAWHAKPGDFVLDSFGLVPVAGDLVKTGKSLHSGFQAWKAIAAGVDTARRTGKLGESGRRIDDDAAGRRRACP